MRRRIAIRGGRSDAAAFGGKSTGGGDDGTGGDDDGIEGLFPIGANMTYVQYENVQYGRDVACALTICPSVAERTGGRAVVDANGGESTEVTALTDANVNRATEILRMHGLVIVRGLLSPLQTVPWGDAVLDDFNSAISRLKCHPTRPVDLMNPNNDNKRNGDDGTSDHDDDEDRAFEPLSYSEMAMREDLRVDLRSGPMMERLRRCQNEMAASVMGSNDGMRTADLTGKDDAEHYRPTIIRGDITGTVVCWRSHPSILAIIRATLNLVTFLSTGVTSADGILAATDLTDRPNPSVWAR